MRSFFQWSVGLIYGLALTLPVGFAAVAPRDISVNENLYGVQIDGAQAWIVGYYGTLLYSADRGVTWREQTSPVRNALFGIRYLGNDKAWINGSHGLLLRTLDGGKSWRAVPTDTSEHLLGSFWLDETHGWIAGSRGVTARTQDGGNSWQKTIVPGDFTFSAVWFTNPLRGWLAGEFGVIFQTQDGGKSWNKQKSPVEVTFSSGESRNLFALLFPKAETGYAFGLDGLVLRTQGGKAWQVIRQRSELEKSNGANHLFGAAVSNDRLWAVGERGTLLYADKNGTRWDQISAAIPRLSLNAIAFGTDGFGLIVGNRGLALRSEDGGRTWKRLKLTLGTAAKDIIGAP
jgi:photosystem II stability/assembly factor-like uncharacterized protein